MKPFHCEAQMKIAEYTAHEKGHEAGDKDLGDDDEFLAVVHVCSIRREKERCICIDTPQRPLLRGRRGFEKID